MPGEIETKDVELFDLKAGVKLKAGHSVILVVNGAYGSPRYGHTEVSEDDGSQYSDGSATDGGAAMPSVTDAQFKAPSARHGGLVEVEATARFAEGCTVEFRFEEREGEGSWRPAGTARARIHGGRATARVRVVHPGWQGPAAAWTRTTAAAQLRVSATIV